MLTRCVYLTTYPVTLKTPQFCHEPPGEIKPSNKRLGLKDLRFGVGLERAFASLTFDKEHIIHSLPLPQIPFS